MKSRTELRRMAEVLNEKILQDVERYQDERLFEAVQALPWTQDDKDLLLKEMEIS